MGKDICSFGIPDSFFHSQRILENLASSFEILNKVNEGFSVAEKISGAYAAMESYQSVVRKVCSNDAFESIIKRATAMQSILNNVQIPTAVNLVATVDKVLPIINKKWDLPSIDWAWIAETLDTYDDCNNDDVENLLTDEICEELNETVQEILCSNDSDNLTKSKFLEFQNRHPVLSFMLIQVLLAFLINIASGVVGDWLSGTIAKKTNIYEEPTSASSVVINIDVNQNVTIVNDVPYYFEVIYTHPETGEEATGYIYKPNVSILQESDEITEINTENFNTQ